MTPSSILVFSQRYQSPLAAGLPGSAATSGSHGDEESRRELNLPRVFGAGDDAEVSCTERRARRLEIRAVEDIKGLGTNLQPGIFRETEIALQREIRAEIIRPT